MTLEQYEELLRRIDRVIELLDRKHEAKDALWDVRGIADWLGLSKVTVEARVVSRPDFPQAVRPVDSKQAQRRWFVADVIEWARDHRGSAPSGRRGRTRKE